MVQPIQNSHNEIFVEEDFEQIIQKTDIIIYGEDFINFPETLLFSAKQKSFLYQILNLDTELLSCSKEDIDTMVTTIGLAKNLMIIKKATRPKGFVAINKQKIKSELIFCHFEQNRKLTINEYVFTSSTLEFYGLGLLSSKKVFFIEEEKLKELSRYFLSEVLE